jgi:hypothetical protein
MRLAALVGRHRATIWKVLKRHGLSRRRRAPRQTLRRYGVSPARLLRVDAYKAPKAWRPVTASPAIATRRPRAQSRPHRRDRDTLATPQRRRRPAGHPRVHQDRR